MALGRVELLRVTTIGGATKGHQVDGKRVQRRRGCKTWERRHAEQRKGEREREIEREQRTKLKRQIHQPHVLGSRAGPRMTWRESATKERELNPRRENSGDERSQRTQVFGSYTKARPDLGREPETPIDGGVKSKER